MKIDNNFAQYISDLIVRMCVAIGLAYIAVRMLWS